MKKDFLDEVMEELQSLKEQSKRPTINLLVPPHEVLRAIGKVARNYELSAEELGAIMNQREMSATEMELLSSLREAEKSE